ncbi:MAG: hypothetical protein KJO38_05810, partial [Gammaproteobacteria bacterium]|nr:hypothetical protein [Gammaproteobacteria bacterium]
HGLGGHGFFHMGHNMNFEAFGADIGAYVEDIVSEVEMNLEGLGESLADISPGEHTRHKILITDDGGVDIDMDIELDELSEQNSELQKQVRELRKEQSAARRELSAARREYERRMEQYEARLEAGRDEAQARTAYEQAEAAMKEARRQYQEGRSAYEKKREVIREEQQAERQRRIAVLASDTLDNFCRYGTSLRSLPADERITLVFDGMGGDGSGEQDLFYVISKQDFSACLSGDIEGGELMQRADSYSF